MEDKAGTEGNSGWADKAIFPAGEEQAVHLGIGSPISNLVVVEIGEEMDHAIYHCLDSSDVERIVVVVPLADLVNRSSYVKANLAVFVVTWVLVLVLL